jgi:hypothetical protein
MRRALRHTKVRKQFGSQAHGGASSYMTLAISTGRYDAFLDHEHDSDEEDADDEGSCWEEDGEVHQVSPFEEVFVYEAKADWREDSLHGILPVRQPAPKSKAKCKPSEAIPMQLRPAWAVRRQSSIGSGGGPRQCPKPSTALAPKAGGVPLNGQAGDLRDDVLGGSGQGAVSNTGLLTELPRPQVSVAGECEASGVPSSWEAAGLRHDGVVAAGPRVEPNAGMLVEQMDLQETVLGHNVVPVSWEDLATDEDCCYRELDLQDTLLGDNVVPASWENLVIDEESCRRELDLHDTLFGDNMVPASWEDLATEDECRHRGLATGSDECCN